MKKEEQKHVEVDKQRLVFMIENFVRNAPKHEESSFVTNQRQDPTAVKVLRCTFFTYDLFFEKDEKDMHPPDIIEYEIKIQKCWGTDIFITELVNGFMKRNKTVVEAYFDTKFYQIGSRFPDEDKVIKVLLQILEDGSYYEERHY